MAYILDVGSSGNKFKMQKTQNFVLFYVFSSNWSRGTKWDHWESFHLSNWLLIIQIIQIISMILWHVWVWKSYFFLIFLKTISDSAREGSLRNENLWQARLLTTHSADSAPTFPDSAVFPSLKFAHRGTCITPSAPEHLRTCIKPSRGLHQAIQGPASIHPDLHHFTATSPTSQKKRLE